MRISKKLWFMPLLLLCIVPMALNAQGDCPGLVNTALEAADTVCESVGRNQVCYGNVSINATAREGVDEFAFQTSGDIVDVSEIASLTLSGMNVETDAWGVAIMKLQANLPDTLPGQNVTFVLFGDVVLENAAEDLPTLNLTAGGTINVLEMPAADSAVVAALDAGAALVADGKLEDGSWLRVRLPEGGHGWLETAAVTADGDVAALAVGEPGAPVFGPMQAFYFRSGISDSACAEAPESGIMIQTPEGAGRVTVNVNGIDLNLGSTAYIRTRPENQIGLSLIEGSGVAIYDGFVQPIPTGSWVTVPTDDEGNVTGPASQPLPYNNDRMSTLPVELLEREVEVPPSLTEEEILEALEAYNEEHSEDDQSDDEADDAGDSDETDESDTDDNDESDEGEDTDDGDSAPDEEDTEDEG